jgi:hypothetical protein
MAHLLELLTDILRTSTIYIIDSMPMLRMQRKRIETCNRQRKKMGVMWLHVRLSTGFSFKIAASLCALGVSNQH